MTEFENGLQKFYDSIPDEDFDFICASMKIKNEQGKKNAKTFHKQKRLSRTYDVIKVYRFTNPFINALYKYYIHNEQELLNKSVNEIIDNISKENYIPDISFLLKYRYNDPILNEYLQSKEFIELIEGLKNTTNQLLESGNENTEYKQEAVQHSTPNGGFTVIDYNSEEIKIAESCYLIGYVENIDLDIQNAPKSSAVRIEMKLLCKDINIGINTEQYASSSTYAAFDNNNTSISPFRSSIYKCKNLDDKIYYLKEYLQNRIIIFKPLIQGTYKNAKIIETYAYTGKEPIGNLFFTIVPFLQSDIHKFEHKLDSSEPILFGDYSKGYLQENASFPPYIIVDKYIYATNAIKGKFGGINTYQIEDNQDSIYKVPYESVCEGSAEYLISVSDKLFFIEKAFLNQLSSLDSSSKQFLHTLINMKPNGPVKTQTSMVLPEKKTEDTSEEDIASIEYNFINNFYLKTIKSSLYYNKDDLVNLHTCIKSNLLTVIAGMSGTGKTQLALEYARMFDLSKDDGTLLFLPISPAYTEPSDILGYLNALNGLYVASETGLVDFLKNASENPSQLYIVIFDEMNLSQIEYWFAPFLSLMEMRNTEDRDLALYNKKSNCVNNQSYPAEINIGDNVRFIGTVNLDETTKRFSDRLLDRTNVISLSKHNFTDALKDIVDQKRVNNTPKSFTYSDYKSWINKIDVMKTLNAENADDQNLLALLDKVHDEISNCDYQKGVSYRMLVALYDYLNNIPNDKEGKPMIDRHKAIDKQISQRLITKLRGSEKQFGKIIGTKIGDQINKGTLVNIFENEANKNSEDKVSDFELTLSLLYEKARELGAYGYTD